MQNLKDLTWEVNEWHDADGKRHISFSLNMYVRAYVRQTRGTRYRSDNHGKYARQYIECQNALKDTFRLVMDLNKFEPFGKQPIGCAINVFGPMAHRSDLSNLEKAVEDAANGQVWHDDRWIYERGHGRKGKADNDLLELHVWEI